MTAEELFELHKVICGTALSTMIKKNHDYTNGSNDPFANFRMAEVIGISAELGLLMRVMDKIKRIETFVSGKDLKVRDESVDDAIEDIINYMILLQGLIQEKRQQDIPVRDYTKPLK